MLLKHNPVQSSPVSRQSGPGQCQDWQIKRCHSFVQREQPVSLKTGGPGVPIEELSGCWFLGRRNFTFRRAPREDQKWGYFFLNGLKFHYFFSNPSLVGRRCCWEAARSYNDNNLTLNVWEITTVFDQVILHLNICTITSTTSTPLPPHHHPLPLLL